MRIGNELGSGKRFSKRKMRNFRKGQNKIRFDKRNTSKRNRQTHMKKARDKVERNKKKAGDKKARNRKARDNKLRDKKARNKKKRNKNIARIANAVPITLYSRVPMNVFAFCWSGPVSSSLL